MKYYESFLKMGCFTYDDARALIGNKQTTNAILKLYINREYIQKVRRGLYVANDLSAREPVVSIFHIGSKISETAIISHHAAFEYYGYTNQVSYDIPVISTTRFNPFHFNGYYYHRMAPVISAGIDKQPCGICVTDIERTVLDSINDFEKDMGFEELIQCISAIPVLKEDKLLEYLKLYNKHFLYQKTGFILEYFKNDLSLSNEFFDFCKKASGNSSRYLTKNIPKDFMGFSNKWHLTIPEHWVYNFLEGGDEDAKI